MRRVPGQSSALQPSQSLRCVRVRARNAARTRFGLGLAERSEGRADLGGEELRLLPGCKVVALVDLVEVDELGVGFLSPSARRLVELSREDAYGSRNLGALDVEEAELVLPVETTRGNPCVRHPGHRDVVEDLVSCEVAYGVAFEGPCDVLVAARVVVEHPGGEGDGRIGEPVQRLRALIHLGRVSDALRIEELQLFPRAALVS